MQFKVAESADKPGPVVDSHSSRRNVTVTLKQPTRRHRGPRHSLPIWPCSRWGLPCRPVARLAVRSYRTISPLPRALADRSAVSFCCTFRRLAPPRHYLAPCPVEPGLSSAPFQVTRLSGRLRQDHCLTTPRPAAANRERGFSPNADARRLRLPRVRVGVDVDGDVAVARVERRIFRAERITGLPPAGQERVDRFSAGQAGLRPPEKSRR